MYTEILARGDYLDYPHAGVLNELAFLGRYPTTETNRNRARARWTYYHFLGVDIEKSAGRTQDAAALADTNNPTLNNPNCAVCHQLMDPVAGGFQDYSNDGRYRPDYPGTDALPPSYKYGAAIGAVEYFDITSRAGISQEVVFNETIDTGVRSLVINLTNGQNNPDGGVPRAVAIEHIAVTLDGRILLDLPALDLIGRPDVTLNGTREFQGLLAILNQGNVSISLGELSAGELNVDARIQGSTLNDGIPPTISVSTQVSSPYQEGDTWFRDMREPGFAGQPAPQGESSIQWLGRQIAADPRFATAAVAFWWPALMGSEILEAPEVSTDQSFSEQLAAFEAQQATIQQLGDAFRQGINGGNPYNARDLLTELVMSPWFRASQASAALDDGRKLQLQNAGVRRLLTPEELEAKTRDILGLVWGDFLAVSAQAGLARELTNWRQTFGLYYGDIDSAGITERARQLTPVMLNVARRHAFEVSCPFVVDDMNRPEGTRRLFNGIEREMTPQTHETAIREKLMDWHALLWDEQVSNGDPGLETSYQLLIDLRETRLRDFSGGGLFGTDTEVCLIPNEFWEQPQSVINELIADPEDMMAVWRQMLVYFLSDSAYLHE
jgi:hypothetical protein